MPHIEPYDSELALKNIETLVINGICTGIYLEPGFRLEKVLMHADDKRIFPLYELCSEKNIPIILQYGGGKNSIELYNPIDIEHIIKNFPSIKIMISHGGWPQCMNFIHLAYRHENIYLSPDCYFSGYPGSQNYICAANGILQDKIVFGSAFPFYSLNDAVNFYIKNINSNIIDKIMYKNAETFLGIN